MEKHKYLGGGVVADLQQGVVRLRDLASSGPSAENARKSHCKNGHALTQGNVATCKKGWRRCRECSSTRERSRRAGGTLE